MTDRIQKMVDEGTASINDYRKLGYRSRNSIVEETGLKLSKNGFLALFDNPDAIIGGVALYKPERAEQILFELIPGSRFNKLAVLFITGKYKGRREQHFYQP